MEILEDFSPEIVAGLLQTEGLTVQNDKYGNVYLRKLPQHLEKSYILGIDEAGRGPLAGPLVYSAVFWPQDPSEHTYRDSKRVGPAKRIDLAKKMSQRAEIGFVVCAISPLFISLNMLNHMRDKELTSEANRKRVISKARKKVKLAADGVTPKGLALESSRPLKLFMHQTALEASHPELSPVYVSEHRKNLNDLSLTCVHDLLKEYLGHQVPVATIYMDMLGPVSTAEAIVKQAMRHSASLRQVVVETKADAKYQVVGAASILAKVIRDHFIQNLNTQHILYRTKDSEMGSGYPSDAITRAWLRSKYLPVIGMPLIIRSSWLPVINLLGEHTPPPINTRGSFRCHLTR